MRVAIALLLVLALALALLLLLLVDRGPGTGPDRPEEAPPVEAPEPHPMSQILIPFETLHIPESSLARYRNRPYLASKISYDSEESSKFALIIFLITS